MNRVYHGTAPWSPRDAPQPLDSILSGPLITLPSSHAAACKIFTATKRGPLQNDVLDNGVYQTRPGRQASTLGSAHIETHGRLHAAADAGGPRWASAPSCVDAVAVSPRSLRRSGSTRSGNARGSNPSRAVTAPSSAWRKYSNIDYPKVMEAAHTAHAIGSVAPFVRANQRLRQNDVLESGTWKTRLSSPASHCNHESTARVRGVTLTPMMAN